MVTYKQKLCFFVPGTLSKKWIYAFALTSVWHDTNMADVIMDSGLITTVSRADVKNAAQRMNKSTKAWGSSVYVKGFKGSIEKRLQDHWDTFFARPQEEQAQILADSRAAFTARRARSKPKISEDGASDTTTTVAGPKKGKSKWRLNTQVATNKSVDLAGVASGGTGDSLAPEMWVTGFLKNTMETPLFLMKSTGTHNPTRLYITKCPGGGGLCREFQILHETSSTAWICQSRIVVGTGACPRKPWKTTGEVCNGTTV
jgi:hypothetical protein